MAGAIRLISIDRGHDPGSFAIMAFGGGGALHAGALIGEVGLSRAIVPRFPGIISALGCVIANLPARSRPDREHHSQRSRRGCARSENGRFRPKGAKAVVEAAGVATERVNVIYELDMRYQGQTHTISAPLAVTLEASRVGVKSAEIVRAAFETSYRRQFSRLLPDIPVRIVSLRTAAIGRRPNFDLTALAPAPGLSLEAARRGTRPVWFAGEWRSAAISSRLDLPVWGDRRRARCVGTTRCDDGGRSRA